MGARPTTAPWLTGNPIGTRAGFVRSSFGYTGTRLNLASLAGQAVRFRFRVGTGRFGGIASAGPLTTSASTPAARRRPAPSLRPACMPHRSSGNVVTLRWTPPATGVAPTGYLLEGGVNPGEVLASIPTGSAAPSTRSSRRPERSTSGCTRFSGAGRSLASNEIRIFVNVPQPPSAPANLLGTVNGNFIALAWKNTFAGGAPTNVVLDVSGDAGHDHSAGGDRRLHLCGCAAGDLHPQPASPERRGCQPFIEPDHPDLPGGLLRRAAGARQPARLRDGSTIFVTWDPAASGPAPTAFILNVSGSFVGSFGTAGRGLSGTVGPGSYTINVVAANPCGNGPATAPITVTVP